MRRLHGHRLPTSDPYGCALERQTRKGEVPARERSFSDSVRLLKGREKGGGGIINLHFLNVLKLLEN